MYSNPGIKLCPYCGEKIASNARHCNYCGESLVRPATPIETYAAQSSAKNRKVARKLFWLGLIITFVGCFHSISSNPEFGGEPLRSFPRAFAAATVSYVVGPIPTAANSFAPPLAGEAGGLVSTLLVFSGAVVLIWACRSFAEAKGYSQTLGYLGVFGLAGILVLMALPDKQAKKARLRYG